MSSSARNPCANPRGMKNCFLLSPVRRTDFHCPNVGEFARMSRAKSITEPCTTLTSFAYAHFPACQCSPRNTPFIDILSFVCTKWQSIPNCPYLNCWYVSEYQPLLSENLSGSITTSPFITLSNFTVIIEFTIFTVKTKRFRLKNLNLGVLYVVCYVSGRVSFHQANRTSRSRDYLVPFLFQEF